jgi:cation-transporting ATPase 13A3/4/5
MSLYSIVQFTTLSFLYTFGSTLSDWQFIYMDLMLIIPLGILINEYAPAKSLSLTRPEVKLISAKVLVPIFSQLILQALFQGVLFFHTRSIVPPTQFADGPNVENAEATTLALFSNFIYITQAFLFSEGRPHREAHYRTLFYKIMR